MTLSVASGVAGLLIAIVFYFLKRDLPRQLAEKNWLFYSASKNKLWFDELYDATIISWFKKLAAFLFVFDQKVIDQAVNEVGIGTVWTSNVKNWIDRYIVDGAVNFVGTFTRVISAILRFIQTGFIQNYLFILVLGILAIVYNVLQ